MPDNWDFSTPTGRGRSRSQTPLPLLTFLLCGLCVFISIAHLTTSPETGGLLYRIGNFGLTSPDELWGGKFYGLFTSFFVHLSWMHLIFNMLWLKQLGTILEETLSPLKFLLFLVLAAGVGSCSELLLSGSTGAGASGVVYAMFGLLWGGRGAIPAWRAVATRDNLNLFLIWGVFCIISTLAGWLAVANGAHFGGLLFGLAVGYLFYAPHRQPLWGLALAGLGLVCVLSLTWIPWSSSWNWHKGGNAFDRHNYRMALGYFQSAVKHEGDREGQSSLWYNISLCWYHIGQEAYQRKDLAGMKEALAQATLARAKSGRDRDSTAPTAAGSSESSDTEAPPSLSDLQKPTNAGKPAPTGKR